MTAHWGIPDPAAVKGTEHQVRKAFLEAFFLLERRISLLLSMPITTMDRLALKKELEEIGRQESARALQK
jgi:arsenate reductase